MKKRTIRIRPAAHSFGGSTVTCRNLVPLRKNGRSFLGAAPAIVRVADGECRPLATRHRADGFAETLWARTPQGGNEGLWTNTPESPSDFTLVADNIHARCAIATRTGFIVMTGDGPLTLSEQPDDGTLAIDSAASSAAPFVSVEALPAGELSASVPAVTMKNVDFSRTAPRLRDSDIKALGDSLCDAYMLLAATAADGGMWMQPVIARCHFVSESGSRLFSSSPAVIAPSGWQCVAEISAECSKSGTDLSVPAIHLKAQAFRLSLRIDGRAALLLADAGVAAIEVECTPQIHVIDRSAAMPWRLTRQSTDSPMLTVALPGATDHFCTRASVFADRLARLAASLDSVARTVSVVRAPFSAGALTVNRIASDDTDTEMRRVDAAIGSVSSAATVPDPSASLLSRIGFPNSFTAGTVTASGDTVAWADITPVPSAVVNVAQICAGWTDGSCSATVRITRRDGSLYSVAASLSRRPLQWASAVLIADSDASMAEIFIKDSDGSVTKGSVTLAPMPDGRHAGHIFTSLRGEIFTPWSGSIPAPSASIPQGPRHPGAIVAAEADDPLLPMSAIECCHSPILSLMPAVGSQSSWDFSRCHLYAFSAAAIHAVSLSPRRRLVSATVIDPRGIASPNAATRTDSSVTALSGGRIIRLKASRTRTEDEETQWRQAVWDAPGQRLWINDRSGNLSVADEDFKAVSAIPTPVDIENIYSGANCVWMADSDALYRPETSAETAACGDLREILWSADIPLPPHCRIAAMELRMGARRFAGTVTLRGSRISGDDATSPLLSMRIDGAIDAPLIFRLAAPARPWASLELKASASTDFHFNDIILYLDCHE